MMELLEQSPFDPLKEWRIVIIADWLPPGTITLKLHIDSPGCHRVQLQR